MSRPRDPIWWQLPLLVLVSVGYESLFIPHGLNPVDEGWPLYAAMQLHAGGSLYQDVFFVFPPGHLLSAWIAYALDPPGVILSRILYAGYSVALVAAVYVLGRRLMPSGFALLGGLLLALGASYTHSQHSVFGYRYLVFGTLALLAFSERLRGGRVGWMLAAGVATGVGLTFRLTPAFATAVGIGVGLLASTREPRRWLTDGAAYAGGVLLVALPVTIGLLLSVGAETLWREVVVRPMVMTELQSLPAPRWYWPPEWRREGYTLAFYAFLFRLGFGVYLGYAVVLVARWLAALRRRAPSPEPLLLAVVVWGAVYFTRSLGRSDAPHIDSALPPLCLLIAHLLSLGFRGEPSRARRTAAACAGAGVLAAWVFFSGADRWLDAEVRGDVPFEVLEGRVRSRPGQWWVDPRVQRIVERTRPGDRILVLGPTSLFYVLSGRPGPGTRDILMPGTFLNDAEEESFVDELRARPPALVVRPEQAFDLRPERGIERTAPRVVQWVDEHYRYYGDQRRFGILLPRDPEMLQRAGPGPP